MHDPSLVEVKAFLPEKEKKNKHKQELLVTSMRSSTREEVLYHKMFFGKEKHKLELQFGAKRGLNWHQKGVSSNTLWDQFWQETPSSTNFGPNFLKVMLFLFRV